MTAAVSLAALGLAGAFLAFIWKLWAAGEKRIERTGALEQDLRRSALRVDELEDANREWRVAVANLEADRARLAARLTVANDHREKLLQQLARSGDPSGIAAGIRAELQALSAVSGATTPAAGEGGDG